jgi:sugar lactone lactonase YvrE
MIAFFVSACSADQSLPTTAWSSAVRHQPAATFANLYVDYGSGIGVFKPGITKPFRTIKDGVSAASGGMAIDSRGYVYLANTNAVTVYAPKSGSVLRSLVKGIVGPGAITLDKIGNVYISTCNACSGSTHGGGITIYGPGGSAFKRRITQGISVAWRLAVSPDGKLYVANWSPIWDVAIYPPGAKTPRQTITKFTSGVQAPSSLAFDSAGHLFLGVSGGEYGKNVIRIYPPNSITPSGVIKGLHYPGSMAIDENSGLLYVVNSNVSSSAQGSIAVYSLSTHKLVSSIINGVANPFCIAVDSTGRLYVGNWGYGSASTPRVTVYSPGGTSLIGTIVLGQRPSALAFGP